MEQKVFQFKTCQDVKKKQVYTTYYTSSQKTRLQKLNSYLVMNSLGDSLSTQQVGREFASRPGHTKDHHKNGTNCLPAMRWGRSLAVQPDCLKGRVVCGTVYRDMHLKDLLLYFCNGLGFLAPQCLIKNVHTRKNRKRASNIDP